MSVTTFVTDKAGLQKFYEAIISSNETYAPVEKSGKFEFKRVMNLSECDPESAIDKTMSIKPLFFPRSAKIMKTITTSAGTDVKETVEDPLAGKRIILGVKHCDARSLQVLDKVYLWDYHDTDYQNRRKNTVIISARCDKAGQHCFCTSLDYDVENMDAMDLLIVNGQDGKVYIKARTEKGEAFLKELTSLQLAVGSQQSAEEEIKKQYDAFAASFLLMMNYKEVN